MSRGGRAGALVAAAALALLAPGAAAAQLTLRLTAVPPGTPPGAVVYVAGTFNGWDPGAPGWALARARRAATRSPSPTRCAAAYRWLFADAPR